MKLIDADKLLEWLNAEYKKLKTNPYDDYSSGKRDMLDIVEQRVEDGTFDPTPPVQPTSATELMILHKADEMAREYKRYFESSINPGDTVKHGTYGIGTVMGYSDRRYVNVQFPDCYTECWTEGLEVITDEQR